MYEKLCTYLLSQQESVYEIQKQLTAFKAVPPNQGGEGEYLKAQWIQNFLNDLGICTTTLYTCPDTRVPQGVRPTLVSTIAGAKEQKLWIFTHIDVVAEGDMSAWDHDPWDVIQKGDFLYGRGTEDNQQALVSTLLLAKALKENAIVPHLSLGMVFMADEESGSKYGLCSVLEKHPELFSSDDLYLVPDFGSSDASMVEVAEKGSLWLRFTVLGKQCHASTPQKGINAFTAASHLVVRLQETLPSLFPAEDSLFTPATSTFVPSMPLTITNGINILPGKAIFHLDCRYLPTVTAEALMDAIQKITQENDAHYGVQTEITTVQSQLPSSVPLPQESYTLLARAIEAVYHVTATPKGVGGGTVAAHLRNRNLPALVWSCIENTCHAPNEHSSLTATLNDSCVFAHMLMSNP